MRPGELPWNWYRPGAERDAARAREKARRLAGEAREAARSRAALGRLSRADRDREVRRLWALGVAGVELAGRFGLSRARVSELVAGLPSRRRYGDPSEVAWPFPRRRAPAADPGPAAAPADRRPVPTSGEVLPAPRAPRGSASGRAKLSEADVSRLRELRASGWTYPALAREFRISRSNVYYILSGSTWSHVPAGPPDAGGPS